MNSAKTSKNKTTPLPKLELRELDRIIGGKGSFEPRKRKEREGRHPKTGQALLLFANPFS